MEQLVKFNIVKSMKKMQSAYFYSLFLFSSSLVLLILHLTKSYSSVNLTSILKFNIDRNHVFLICNGILVILVKSSSSVSMSSSSSQDSSNSDYSSSTNTNAVPIVGADQRKLQQEFSALTSEQSNVIKTEQFLTVEETSITESVHVQNHEIVVSECEVVHVHDHHDDDDDGGYDDHEDVIDDEDDEGAEELNKRCEDFIRKMKQGIISEGRNDVRLARNYVC